MSNSGTTPFIPPLNTPGPSPNPPQPPLVPQPPTGPNQQYPAWAAQPQGAGSYPIYPSTPYTAAQGTPYIPFTSPHPGMSQYFPATGPPQQPMQLPPDFGGGYPHFQNPAVPPWAQQAVPPWAAGPSGPHPGTPWPGHAAPPGTPWTQGYPSPYPPAGPPMAGFGPPPPPQARPAWPGAGGYTPGGGGDQWQAQNMPPWAQQQAAQMAMQQQQMAMMSGGMMGGGMPGMMGGPGMGLGLGGGYGMMDQQQPLSRAIGQVGDRVGQFQAGPHYGPVLEPFLIRAVRAQTRLNPLLNPVSDNGATPPPFLKWNMLFPSNQCQRSDEAVHLSWSNGRQEPATFPRVTQIRLVSEAFPWSIDIVARNRDIGVTCGELVDYLSRDMYRLTSQAEYEGLPSARKRIVAEAYRHNRSRANGVPGGQLNPGMLRLDWLGQDTMFGGVRENDRLVRRLCGDSLPCTFELVCMRRYPMTAEELRNQEILQRNANERAARRRSARAARPTVESVRGDDEDGEDDDDGTLTSDDEDEDQGRRGRRGRAAG
ncbi:hypothetical protein B0H16DRAFT_402625 [Mycena metata]|uniref:DUF6699 domain-containing protein n=1 Tax=Mycena metata TaxID=1033252 RepID=A0AAD7JJH9_9AGAR|nr:hypothetical protein B0H16DRAFT_402625 [Mycena metata]